MRGGGRGVDDAQFEICKRHAHRQTGRKASDDLFLVVVLNKIQHVNNVTARFVDAVQQIADPKSGSYVRVLLYYMQWNSYLYNSTTTATKYRCVCSQSRYL